MANLCILYGIMLALNILVCLIYKRLGYWEVYERHYQNDFNTIDTQRDAEQQAYMDRSTRGIVKISFRRSVLSFFLGVIAAPALTLLLNKAFSLGIAGDTAEFALFRTIFLIAAVVLFAVSLFAQWRYRDGNRVVAVLHETRRRASLNPNAWSAVTKYIQKMYFVTELSFAALFMLGFVLFIKLFTNLFS